MQEKERAVKKRSGLTLVESVIAMFVAAILVVGFLQACSSGALMLKNLRCRVRAINIAQAEIEDIKARGNEGIDVAIYTPFLSTPVVIDEGVTVGPIDDIAGEMRTTAMDVVSGPTNGKKIVVEVLWNFMGEAKSELLETVIYSRLQG